MAELDTSGGGKHKGGKVRSKKASTRVDLTAMVDLAFLLITFFILTTTLQKPKSMDLIMPDKEDHTKTDPIADNRSLTLLLGDNNKLEWYTGQFLKPIAGPTVTDYSKNGLRKVLEEQAKKIQETAGKGMFVVIKPSSQSVYNNLVAVMDELNIMNNQYRAIVEITPSEIEILKREGLYK